MSTAIPSLKLFPLYPGGPVVQGNSGTLNANSAFYTRANQFSPSYAVNIPNTTDSLNNTYYSLQADQTLRQQALSQASNFSGLLGLDANTPGGFRRLSVPTAPPDIPSVYQSIINLYTITDANYAELMSQSEFRIPNLGLGLKITTDGMGGVDTIAIDPSARALLPNLSVLSKNFAGPNRTKITTGATFNVGSGLGNSSPVSSKPILKPKPRLGNTPTSIAPTVKTAPVLPKTSTPGSINPFLSKTVLERLAQRNVPSTGLAVVGANSQLTAEQSRQLATHQAGLNLSSTGDFRKTVAELASAARPQENYLNAHRKIPVDRLMDGRLPLAPSLPTGNTQRNPVGDASQNNLALGSEILDAGSRRSSGGYVPFRSGASFEQNPQSGFFLGGQTGQGGGNTNLGSGLMSGQNQRQGTPQRRPLTLMA